MFAKMLFQRHIFLWLPCRLRGQSGEGSPLSSDYLHNDLRTHYRVRPFREAKLRSKIPRVCAHRATENGRLSRGLNLLLPSLCPPLDFPNALHILRGLRNYQHANRCVLILIYRFV